MRERKGMLISLHVKNLALIEESQVFFGEGLNIFSGETGAGKSMLIGSVSIGLGGKAGKDIERDPERPAEVELEFSIDSEEQRRKFEEYEIPVDEDGLVIIKRRVKNGKSLYRVNGVAVNNPMVRDISSVLIDIHGQHEHQSLLYQKNHLKLLDRYAGDGAKSAYERYRSHYEVYKELKKELEEADTDESARLREADLLRYEVSEIEKAELKEGEDEELEKRYSLMNNSRKITEAAGSAAELMGGDESAGELTGRALRSLAEIAEADENAKNLYDELASVDALISDFRRDLEEYLHTVEFSQDEFEDTASRLDLINQLKMKYGASVSEINASLEERQKKLERIENFDAYINDLKQKIAAEEKELSEVSKELSKERKAAAAELETKLVAALVSLNFIDVKFNIDISDSDDYTVSGRDRVEFTISTNPGEALKPLREIASGGELSRVMLALKTVLADTDSIDTLIFDEIDTGISGRTAQMVSESLAELSRRHQVICITHLPQIAAMADHHFLIEKSVKNERTVTCINELEGDAITDELARIISGAEVTDTVKRSAEEMKKLADEVKAKVS